MHVHHKHNSIIIIFAAIMCTFVLIGCGEEDTTAEGGDATGAPTVPPAYTIVPDFGDLDNTGSGAAAAGSETGYIHNFRSPAEGEPSVSPEACIIDNYLRASTQVGFWNLALVVTLAVPVWSFGESFNHTPEQQADGSWVWSYGAHIPSPNGILHTAELRGEIVDSTVYWEMYITKAGFYEDFLWYSGESDLLATQGSWTLKKSPQDDVNWIGITWSRGLIDGTWQVKYMNIEEGGNENGGYIEYGVTSGQDFDAFYDIYYKSLDNLVEIESNRTSKAGRVKNSAHFSDEDWHYWDGSHCDDPTQ